MSSRLYCACLAFVLSALTAVPSLLAEEHTVAMDLRHNMPFVQVMVNGKGPFTFSIDTGTGGQALVSPELIQQLGLPVIGEDEVGDPSGINSHKVPQVRIESLKVAGLEFKNVEATEHRPSQREGQCDGILGFVLFRDYLLTLDYPGKQFTVASGSLKPDGGNTVVPFTMPDSVPVIELSVGPQKVEAHVDSRGLGFSFPRSLLRAGSSCPIRLWLDVAALYPTSSKSRARSWRAMSVWEAIPSRSPSLPSIPFFP